jgi:hypothetical protein
MNKITKSLVMLLVASLCFISFSCQQTESNELFVYGNWTSTTSVSYSIGLFGITMKDSSGNKTYSGSNLTIIPYSATAGMIFIKLTSALKTNGVTYTELASESSDIGNWVGFLYKDLTSISLSIKKASKSSGKTSMSTLNEAISEFSIDNGYFSEFDYCYRSL